MSAIPKYSLQQSAPASPQKIYVFAVEHVKTHSDDFVAISSKAATGIVLAKPEKSIAFHWRGMIHQNRPGQLPMHTRDVKPDLEKLAGSFSECYMEHRNPELESAGKASYSLNFHIDPAHREAVENSCTPTHKLKIRELSELEQDQFVKLFQEANIRIANVGDANL
jgi:hypothetical protein